jgi:hypothetical protein
MAVPVASQKEQCSTQMLDPLLPEMGPAPSGCALPGMTIHSKPRGTRDVLRNYDGLHGQLTSPHVGKETGGGWPHGHALYEDSSPSGLCTRGQGVLSLGAGRS